MLRPSPSPASRLRSSSRSPFASSPRKVGRVHHGHHGVELRERAEAETVLEFPVEGGRHRHRFGDAGGLDHQLIESPLSGQGADGVDQILTQRAADASVGQLDQLLLRAVEMTLARDEGRVDVDLAHVVDDDGDPPAIAIGENVVEECGLACAQKSGTARLPVAASFLNGNHCHYRQQRAGLLHCRGTTRELALGPRQTEMITKGRTRVFGPEKTAILQDRDHTLGEDLESTRVVRRHDVEAVSSTAGEPLLDRVGYLLGGSGKHPVPARTRQSMKEATNRRTLALDDAGDHLQSAFACCR